jgi:A/G-specific adenine glycosylase
MHDICLARHTGRQAELPAAKPKKAIPERKTSVLLLTDGQHVLLERRPPSGIWGGLLALPEGDAGNAEIFALHHGCCVLNTQALAPLKHSFTHFRLTIHPVCCTVKAHPRQVAEGGSNAGWEWLDLQNMETAALPAPIRTLLRRWSDTAASAARTQPPVPAG